jgi:hypothetical protein
MRWEVETRSPDREPYSRDACGYFRVRYAPPRRTSEGRDFQVAKIPGRGQVVAGIITCYDHVLKPGGTCEGDLRVHPDGIVTPQVESDGSESWACYGWGFGHPPQAEPSASYDGTRPTWSMNRLLLGDFYPFRDGIDFRIEHGPRNDSRMTMSGAVFYYGVDEAGMVLTDLIDIGSPGSEALHEYRIEGQTFDGRIRTHYEGNADEIALADTARAFNGFSEFTVAVRPDNAGVRLRRRSDQQKGRQRARVFVDGQPVVERTWYHADRNPFQRWLEDEFEIPVKYTRDKDRIRVRLEFVPAAEAPELPTEETEHPYAEGTTICDRPSDAWSEARYWVFSHLP